MELHEVPKNEQDEIFRRLDDYIRNLADEQKRIVYRSQSDLALFIRDAIKSIAALLGYIIALPIAYAEAAAEGFMEGFRRGRNLGRE
jgi:hypothetical protein